MQILKEVSIVVMILSIVAIAAVVGVQGISSVNEQMEISTAVETIRCGEIVDMKTVNVGNAISGYDTHWRIYIEGNYEYNGETYLGQRYFDVSEDTYRAYKVGDTFDITDYKTVSGDS